MYMIHICEIIIFICNIYIIMNIYVYDTWQTIFFFERSKTKEVTCRTLFWVEHEYMQFSYNG